MNTSTAVSILYQVLYQVCMNHGRWGRNTSFSLPTAPALGRLPQRVSRTAASRCWLRFHRIFGLPGILEVPPSGVACRGGTEWLRAIAGRRKCFCERRGQEAVQDDQGGWRVLGRRYTWTGKAQGVILRWTMEVQIATTAVGTPT